MQFLAIFQRSSRQVPPILLRRLLAVIVLGATMFSSAESALALSGDGLVHHESAGAAEAHRDLGVGSEHGHEDIVPLQHPHRHDGGHRHGTLADHCTHGHAVGQTVAVRWQAASILRPDPIVSVGVSFSDADSRRELRPPRA